MSQALVKRTSFNEKEKSNNSIKESNVQENRIKKISKKNF